MPEKSEKGWNDWTMKVLQQLVELNSNQEQLARELKERFSQVSEKVEEKYSQLQSKFNERCDNIETKMDKIDELLTGRNDPSKGVIVRLDRLEQNEIKRTWLLRATVASCIAAIITTIATWVKH